MQTTTLRSRPLAPAFRRFDPGEPRDPHGKWAKGGGGAPQAASLARPVDELAEMGGSGDHGADVIPAGAKGGSHEAALARQAEAVDKRFGPEKIRPPDLTPAPDLPSYDEVSSFYGAEPLDRSLRDFEKQAVNDYVAPDTNARINGGLRRGHLAERYKAEVDTLDGVIAAHTLNAPVEMYRGISLSPALAKQLQPGKVFTDKGYTSASVSRKWAHMFAEMRSGHHTEGQGLQEADTVAGAPAIMRITVPKGAHMAPGESDIGEYILPRGSRYRVDKVTGGVIDLTALGAAAQAAARAAAHGSAARRAARPQPAAAAARMAWAPDEIEFEGEAQARSYDMHLSPLPPQPPIALRKFHPDEPRDPHGKWIGGGLAELKKARAADKAHAVQYTGPSFAREPKLTPPKALDKAWTDRYDASFTKQDDDAAQAAARRALLAYSQKRIMEAITTPPDQMTDEQVAFASRLIGRLTGEQISEHVDKLRDGGVPDPIVSHVKGVVQDLHKEARTEQNSDAKQKIITHIAAILAAVGLTLAGLAFPVSAAIAAIVLALPALSQEFIDFRHDYVSRHKAAKEAAKATGRSLRTAETPIVSTVHNPFGSPAGPGLFRVKGLQLPAYIQNVAHAFARSGLPESEAIRRAVGVVQDWAAGRTPNGKGHVHPDVQAAAARAIAEWEAAKAAAHGSK